MYWTFLDYPLFIEHDGCDEQSIACHKDNDEQSVVKHNAPDE